MRKDIQYRDLPGGPLMVKFADELPLGTLCSRCGMLSKDMYEDPSSHAFCSICIFECSDRKKIHCKYENKDVSVDEMMPAIDIINIVMDQVVFCPNTRDDGNSCTEHCSLKDLEVHYLECDKTQIICLSCGDPVRGIDWQHHVTSCPQQTVQCQHCVVAVPRWKLEQHERVCSYNPRAIREFPSCEAATVDSTTRSLRDSHPNEERIPHPRSASGHCATPVAMPTVLRETEGVVIQSCPVCNRNVKSINMDKHLDVCLRQTHPPDPVESSETPNMPTALPKRETDATTVPVHIYPQFQPKEYILRGSSTPNAPPLERPDERRQDWVVPDFSMEHYAEEGQRQRHFEMGAMEAEGYGFESGFEQLSIPDVPPESSVNMRGEHVRARDQGGHSHAVPSGIVVAQTSRPEEASNSIFGYVSNLFAHAVQMGPAVCAGFVALLTTEQNPILHESELEHWQ